MEITNLSIVYFSATYTTRKIVRLIAESFQNDSQEYDITKEQVESEIFSHKDDLLIVGVPVYAGRVPVEAMESLTRFKGNDTPAIIVCVYGNREYDDALLELKTTVQNNGFKVIAAGAFIAQHSIFPEVGQNRPDEDDLLFIKEFARKSAALIKSIENAGSLPDIQVKGNFPYKRPGNIPLRPRGDKRCNNCGTCVKVCPVKAIVAVAPRKTDKDRCISCGRCIVVCPERARHFGGLLYKLVRKKFVKAYSVRKYPEMIMGE